MKKLNQTGFAAVEAVLIIVVVGILGFTGWFVWNSKQNSNAALDAANNSSESLATPEATDSVVIQKVKYSQLPQDFKTVYAKHASSDDRMCVNKDGIPLDESGSTYEEGVQYVSEKYVTIGECHSAAIYAKYNGEWTFVAMSQGGFLCDVLKKYDVPPVLLKYGNPYSVPNCYDSYGLDSKPVVYK